MSFQLADPSTYTKRRAQPISRRKLTPKTLDDQMLEVIGHIRESGLKPQQIASDAAATGYSVAASTIYRWLDEKTFRPHWYTVRAVMSALGWENTWVKRKKR